MTARFSHEFVEALTNTDPYGSSQGIRSAIPVNGGLCEIADVCVNDNYQLPSGVTVQAYWSNAARTCIHPG